MNSSEYFRRERIGGICGILAIFCWIGCLALAGGALVSISQSAVEKSDLADAMLTREEYLTERRIGNQYGRYASEYWKVVVLQSDRLRWEAVNVEVAKSFGIESELEAEIQKAILAGFRTVPNEKLDRLIVKEFDQMQERLPEARRRQSFSQRFKDAMAFTGGVAVFGVVGWVLSSVKSKLSDPMDGSVIID